MGEQGEREGKNNFEKTEEKREENEEGTRCGLREPIIDIAGNGPRKHILGCQKM